MNRTRKPTPANEAPPAPVRPGRDDVHEQRVPDQAAEATVERESESTRLRRPPNVDEAGGR